MKKKIAKIITDIFYLPFGIVVVVAIVISTAFVVIKSFYKDIKYDFSNTAFNILFWVFLVGGILILKWVIDTIGKKKQNKKM